DLLFEIDPRPYRAEMKKAEAAVTLAQTVLARVEADHKRARRLFERKTLGKEELDKVAAAREEARARLHLARAVPQIADLNLAYTRVYAPINGRISRRLVDPGNLVKVDETTLATLVSTRPMYVYFDVDERTLLALRRAMLGVKGAEDRRSRVAIQLADEKGF